MFVLKKSNSYLWPVKVEIPKDGGHFEKESFDIEFKRVSESRIKDVFGPVSEGKERTSDLSFCREVVVGWKNVKDEHGDDVQFSDTKLNELLEIPSVAKSIVLAFMESIAGSKVKNS